MQTSNTHWAGAYWTVAPPSVAIIPLATFVAGTASVISRYVAEELKAELPASTAFFAAPGPVGHAVIGAACLLLIACLLPLRRRFRATVTAAILFIAQTAYCLATALSTYLPFVCISYRLT